MLRSVIVEALKVDSLQKLCSSLEPILRRVVRPIFLLLFILFYQFFCSVGFQETVNDWFVVHWLFPFPFGIGLVTMSHS